MNKNFVLIALLVGFSSLFAKAALAAQPLTLYELFDNAGLDPVIQYHRYV
jgi:hypothetical protein